MSAPEGGSAVIGRRAVLAASVLAAVSWPDRPVVASSVDGRGITDADIKAGFAALSDAPIRFQDGRIFRLADFRGQALLVNFWANWCVDCRAEFASMAALQHAAGGAAELAVVLVSQSGDWAKDQLMARQTGLSFPLAVLEEPATRAGNQATGTMLLGGMVGNMARYALPVCYMVGRSGQVVLGGVGGMDWVGPLATSKAAAALHR